MSHLDFASRLGSGGQRTTDGHKACLPAVDAAFGTSIGCPMLAKQYGKVHASEARYGRE